MAKRTLRRVIDKSVEREQRLPHILFVGAAGTGKSTFSHVVAEEFCVDVYSVSAPISYDTLFDLRDCMLPNDILQIEEIHLQAVMERRGRQAATQPEVLYQIMEDGVMLTPEGPVPFPRVSVVGTTTDEGMLPDAFIRRFPLRPHLERYSYGDMYRIAKLNAQQLDVTITESAAQKFSLASRFLPWQINTFMQSAVLFAPGDKVTTKVAREVLRSMNTTEDGLSADMQAMLRFLYTRGKQTLADGSVRYQASAQSIATALGKSRDAKAIYLRVEPWLIDQGYVQVLPQGRRLTDAGIKRAKDL